MGKLALCGRLLSSCRATLTAAVQWRAPLIEAARIAPCQHLPPACPLHGVHVQGSLVRQRGSCQLSWIHGCSQEMQTPIICSSAGGQPELYTVTN